MRRLAAKSSAPGQSINKTLDTVGYGVTGTRPMNRPCVLFRLTVSDVAPVVRYQPSSGTDAPAPSAVDRAHALHQAGEVGHLVGRRCLDLDRLAEAEEAHVHEFQAVEAGLELSEQEARIEPQGVLRLVERGVFCRHPLRPGNLHELDQA